MKCEKCKREIDSIPCKFCGAPRQVHKAVGYPEEDPPKSTNASDSEE